MSSEKHNVGVDGGLVDQDFSPHSYHTLTVTNENTVAAQLLGSSLTDGIAREMSIVSGTVEDKIQSAILAAIDKFITPRIELAVRSMNASSGGHAASVTAVSVRGEQVSTTASFQNVSDRNITLHELIVNDETQGIIPDKANEFSVPGTHFERQPHTHYSTSNIKVFNLQYIPLWIVHLHLSAF